MSYIKKTIFVFILLFNYSICCQEELLLIKNELKTSSFDVKQIFSAVDTRTNNFSIFLLDDEDLNGYLFNESFEQKASLQANALPNKYKVILGSLLDDKKTTLFFSNRNNNKFGTYTFDFKTKKTEEKELDLPIQTEKFLESISYKNKFYILTITKKSSIINIYGFSANKFEKHIIDLSNIRFIDNSYRLKTLYSLTGLDDVNESISKIDIETPVSPKFAFNPIKLFVKNNKAIITLDQAFYKTQIVSIDIENYSAETYSIEQPYIFVETSFKSSNSFLHNNTFFQFASNSEKCVFSIKDFRSFETLKEYSIVKNGLLSFKNSQKPPTKKEKRKTNQFLSKNTTNDMGVSVYKNDDSFEIKLGSYQYPASGGGMMMPGFGTFNMTSPGNVGFTPGHPIQVFNIYGGSGIIENTLNLVFDNDFNYIEGQKEFEENVFDRLTDFIETNDKHINAKTILKYEDYFILALSHDNSGFLRLIKFSK